MVWFIGMTTGKCNTPIVKVKIRKVSRSILINQ